MRSLFIALFLASLILAVGARAGRADTFDVLDDNVDMMWGNVLDDWDTSWGIPASDFDLLARDRPWYCSILEGPSCNEGQVLLCSARIGSCGFSCSCVPIRTAVATVGIRG
jgi:hypothetical protein